MKTDWISKLLKLMCVLAIAVCIGRVAHKAQIVDWSFADSKGSLLSGQAFVEHGSFDLQPYKENLHSFGWQLFKNKDSIVYAYPLGTTLLHLPVIWIWTKEGYDLSDPYIEAALNRDLAAYSLGIIFLLTVLLFRRRCSFPESVLYSALLILGTSAFSTFGLALWNLNYAVIFALLVILVLEKEEWMERGDTGWILGILLFLGFIVRPSFALMIVITFGYLLLFYRKHLFRAATISGLLLAVYIMFSLNTFGLILPGHYQMSDFAFGPRVIINLVSQLVSPSRGFLVFSPVFLFTIAGIIIFRRRLFTKAPIVAMGIWLVSLALFLSSWFLWWGGGGYGNRLWTETLPAWFYFSALTWPELFRVADGKKVKRGLLVGSFAIVAIFSMWVHVIQGANNQWTVTWHNEPSKDRNPRYFWSFRYPQFLASENQVKELVEEHRLNEIETHGTRFGTYSITTPGFVFKNWYQQEGQENPSRWTAGKRSEIIIPFDSLNLDQNTLPEKVLVCLEGTTYRNQNISVIINGERIGKIKTVNKDPRSLFYTDWFTLEPGKPLEIAFEIRDPKVPAVESPGTSVDNRELGLRLSALHLHK